VIDEARHRQRLRRKRTAIAVLGACLLAVVAWASKGAATRPQTATPNERSLTQELNHDTRPSAFNVRLVPMVNFVGVPGWCEVPEEHGVAGGSACGGVPTSTQPFLQIYGSGEASSPDETQVAVTDPQITAILVEGRRVPTEALPGLPYGLRGARVVTRVGATLAAVDAHGHVLPQRWRQTPPQATVRHWRYPQRPPAGACELRASWLPGLTARAGAVATAIRPFPGQLVGHAFLPCAATEYELLGEPLKAIVVLDAALPGGRAAGLPSFHAVKGAPGMFAAGSLTATRYGNAWLIVEQGHGPDERMLLLRHLAVSLHLPPLGR